MRRPIPFAVIGCLFGGMACAPRPGARPATAAPAPLEAGAVPYPTSPPPRWPDPPPAPPPEVVPEIAPTANVTLAHLEVPGAPGQRLLLSARWRDPQMRYDAFSCVPARAGEFADPILGVGSTVDDGYDGVLLISRSGDLVAEIVAAPDAVPRAFRAVFASLTAASEDRRTPAVSTFEEPWFPRVGHIARLALDRPLTQRRLVVTPDRCARLFRALKGQDTGWRVVGVGGVTMVDLVATWRAAFAAWGGGEPVPSAQPSKRAPAAPDRWVYVVEVPGRHRPAVALAFRGPEDPLTPLIRAFVHDPRVTQPHHAINEMLRDEVGASYGAYGMAADRDLLIVAEIDPDRLEAALSRWPAVMDRFAQQIDAEAARSELLGRIRNFVGQQKHPRPFDIEPWLRLGGLARAVGLARGASDAEIEAVARGGLSMDAAAVVVVTGDEVRDEGGRPVRTLVEQVVRSGALGHRRVRVIRLPAPPAGRTSTATGREKPGGRSAAADESGPEDG